MESLVACLERDLCEKSRSLRRLSLRKLRVRWSQIAEATAHGQAFELPDRMRLRPVNS
jgi:hypothetical protein